MNQMSCHSLIAKQLRFVSCELAVYSFTALTMPRDNCCSILGPCRPSVMLRDWAEGLAIVEMYQVNYQAETTASCLTWVLC